MNNQISETRPKYFPSLVPVIMIVFAIVVCVLSVSAWGAYNRLTIWLNQLAWQTSQPSTYFIEVYGNGCSGTSFVENNTQLRFNGQENCNDVLHWSNLTVEELFRVAESLCASRAATDCMIEFDSQYHYPKEIFRFDSVGIIVSDFGACEQASDCQT